MSYTGDIKSYLKQIQTDVLPSSDLGRYKQNANGLYLLNRDNSIELRVELPDSKGFGLYSHEKCAPKRYAIENPSSVGEYKPIFYRYYETGILNAFSKMIVNSALNIYPTPLNVYATTQEMAASNSIGISTIDLNNLKTNDGENMVSMRLDMLLHSVGLNHEIDSFLDFQKMLESGRLSKVLTPRAIVQVGLGSLFIPNAIGETDANSRNMILLKKQGEDKFDIAVRIDGESNTYITDAEHSRSGRKQVPKGIYGQNEDLEVFLGAIKSRDVNVDWDLFSQFNVLARALCSRTNIDNAVFKSYMTNSGKVSDAMSYSAKSRYGEEAFFDFSEKTIDRSARYFDNIFTTLANASKEPPFATSNSKYMDILITDGSKPGLLQQRTFNQEGKEI